MSHIHEKDVEESLEGCFLVLSLDLMEGKKYGVI